VCFLDGLWGHRIVMGPRARCRTAGSQEAHENGRGGKVIVSLVVGGCILISLGSFAVGYGFPWYYSDDAE